MTNKLLEKVHAAIRQHGMLQPGDRVGVAVSGGADSVALLLLLEELRDELGITLLVLHFNHLLRGAASEEDEKFVRDSAGARGMEFICGREDVAAEAQRQHANLEDVARQLRYRFFSGVVLEGRATRVAVAHTADDQAETVLARLVRGTGPLGLAGIYPVLGPVVRPLLGVRRAELRDYLTMRGQAWCEDETNQDAARLRARIRQRLLPLLEQDFTPAIVAHLNSLADLARADERFWSALLEDRFRALVDQSPEGHSISVENLLSPIAWQTAEPAGLRDPEPVRALAQRLIRRILAEVQGDRRRLSARHVEQVIRLAAESSSGHRVELPGGLVVERRLDRLVFRPADFRSGGTATRDSGSGPSAYSYTVDLPRKGVTVVEIAELGKRVSLKLIDWPLPASDTRDAIQVLDADLLGPPLVLRNWQPGDAYRPLGRKRVRKLKSLLLERRISAPERAGWPVLTSAGRLVWARGLPAAAEFAARRRTRTGLVIAEETQ